MAFKFSYAKGTYLNRLNSANCSLMYVMLMNLLERAGKVGIYLMVFFHPWPFTVDN